MKTPFSLAYGSEAITSPNVVVPNISTVLPNLEQNEKKMATNLDLAVECLQPEKVLRVISHHSLDHVQDEKVRILKQLDGQRPRMLKIISCYDIIAYE